MQVYLWGLNTHHQIRPNNKKRIKIPQKVSFPIAISSVSFSKSLMMMLSNHGDVYEYRSVNDMRRIDQLFGITKLKCGDYHYAAVSKKGELYTWGTGDNGCLAMEPVEQQLDPFKVAVEVVDVYCGPSNTFILNQSNELYACGDNSFGQLGIGTNNQDEQLAKVSINGIVIEVASDNTHTLFLTSQGEIYIAGQNKNGCLGFESIGQKVNIPIKVFSKDKFVSIACGGYSAAVSQKGSIFTWGHCPHGLITTPSIIDKVSKRFTEVKSSNNNCYALSEDGQLWVWGNNKYGELGVGDVEQRNKPFPVILLEQTNLEKIFVGMDSVLCVGRQRTSLSSTFKRQCCDKKRNSSISVNKSLRQSRNYRSSSRGRSANSKSRNSNHKSKSKQLKSRESKQMTSKQPKLHLKQFMKSQQIMKQTIKEQLKQHLIENKSTHNKLLKNKLISNKCPIKVIDDYCDRQSFIEGEFEGTYSSIPHYQSNISKREEHPKQFKAGLMKTDGLKNYKMEEVLLQNRELRTIIEEKDAIIEDIVGKIQALEQAIEERDSKDQITLREHINKQVQRMENRYIDEISKLSEVISGFAMRYNTETTNAYDTLIHRDKEPMNNEKIIRNITTKCKGKHIDTEQSMPNQDNIARKLSFKGRNSQVEENQKSTIIHCIAEQKSSQQQLEEKVKQLESRITLMAESFEFQLQNSVRQLDMYRHKVKELSRIVAEKNQVIIQLQNGPAQEIFTLQNISPNIRNIQNMRDGMELRGEKSIIKLKERSNNHINRVIENIEKNKRRISESADKLINILQAT